MDAGETQRQVPGAIDQAVHRELIYLLFGSPAVPLINGVGVVVTAGVLWRIFPLRISLCWLIVSLTIVLLRLTLWFRFSKRASAIGSVDPWARRFTLTTAMIGCMWGMTASATWVAHASIYPFFVAYVVAGLSAGAAIRLSPHPPAFYAFIGTAAPPMVIALLLHGRLISTTMGALLLTFIVVMVVEGRENHQRLADSIRLKIEQKLLNADLQKVTLNLTEQITEREKIALALEESSERFQAIASNALDAIIISDSAGSVVYWNPAAERTFGFTAAETTGQPVHNLLAPIRDRENANRRYAEFAATGEGAVLGSTVRLRAMRKDGCEFPADLSVSSMNLGGVRYALGIVRDVSEQERAMKALEERQLQLEEAQRLAHIGNWTFDPETGETTWSDELFRIFGRDRALPPPTPAEFKGFLAPESFARTTQAVQACLTGGLAFEIDLELPNADAAPRWASMRGEARKDPNGMHLRGTCQDITARKGAEALAREQESIFRSLVEQNMTGIFIISEDATIVYVNPAGLGMLGVLDESVILGRPVLEWINDPDRARSGAVIGGILEGRERAAKLALTVLRVDGTPIDVIAEGAIATFKGRRAIITVLVDITERLRAEDEIVKLNFQMAEMLAVLRRRESDLTSIAKLSDMLQSCRTVTEAYPVIAEIAATLFPDASGSLAMVNADTQDLIRVSAWGSEPAAPLPGFQERDCQALRADREYESTGTESTVLCQHLGVAWNRPHLCIPLKVQGRTSGLASLALAEGATFDEATRQVFHSFADVVKLSLANLQFRESLIEQAFRDPLTGLFNRRYLMETLPREIRRAQRRGAPLTIAMLDIDHFKRFNDVYGHDAGDLVLAELAAQFCGALRADDVACRYGGEEFLFLLPDCSLVTAYQRMTDISGKIRGRNNIFCGESLPGTTLSIGLAALTDSLSTSEGLITAADKAMYAAKRMGRDRIECFETSPPACLAKPSRMAGKA
ncbi:MAG TPA: diguanylate cyclase [Acidobacteriaceae bacterium]|jgi:diguanylate cyclase (GGDEF)-like protein/PAS domain S-box-containing protein|nr:diguanylate cyclase [Acidobacteriaceae bacterium]